MEGLSLTKHASSRLRQRGRSVTDMETVLRFGTRIDKHCVILMNKDAEQEIARMKRKIALLDRLRGWKVVEDDGHIITTYRPPKVRIHRRSRRATG